MKRSPLLPLVCSLPCFTELAAAEFQVFGILESELKLSRVNALSANGNVLVGTGLTVDGSNEAFIWTREGGLTMLGTMPGAFYSYGNGVSANGQYVVGHVLSEVDGHPTPFIWSAQDGKVPLPRTPGGEQATAKDVSDDGRIIVGGADTEESSSLNNQAVRWVNGVLEPLGDLPGGSVEGTAHSVSTDGLVSVGYSTKGGPLGAFRHHPATGMIDLGLLPGVTGYGSSEALAVSGTGKYIVGTTRSLTDSFNVMFIWSQDGGMKDLGRVGNGDYNTKATAVNRKGTVVVGTNTTKAMVWTAKYGTKELRLFLEQDCGINLDGWRPVDAVISDDGTTIAGSARKDGVYGYHAYVAVIPSSIANDSDADGLDDEWELQYFSGLAATPQGDADADGNSNLLEARLGLNPVSGSSRFTATCSTTGALEWPGAEGLTFKIERSADLDEWKTLEEAMPGIAGTMSFTDPAPLPRRGYYRVSLNE